MYDVIAIIAIIILFYLIFRAEHFEGAYNFVRLWDLYTPWATYSAADGSFLDTTFRKDVKYLEYDFTMGPAYMEFWGYMGAGDPKTQARGGALGPGVNNLYMDPTWELILDTRMVTDGVMNLKGMYELHRAYHGYRLVLDFRHT